LKIRDKFNKELKKTRRRKREKTGGGSVKPGPFWGEVNTGKRNRDGKEEPQSGKGEKKKLEEVSNNQLEGTSRLVGHDGKTLKGVTLWGTADL